MNFVHVPKTGGFSIAEAFGLSAGDHLPASQCGEGFLFAFVRNPYERLWSGWNFIERPKTKESFRDFVLRRGFDGASDIFYPMAYYLDAPVGFIGRYEYFAQDVRRLASIIPQVNPLPHLNKSDAGPWADAYDEETKGIVADFYELDFVRFGYGR